MSVPTEVRRALEEARSAGVDFADAWPTAIAGVPDRQWREALARTSAAWRAACERDGHAPPWTVALETASGLLAA